MLNVMQLAGFEARPIQWRTVSSYAPTVTQSGGWNGYSIRQRINDNVLNNGVVAPFPSGIGNARHARISIVAGSGGPLDVQSAWIGNLDPAQVNGPSWTNAKNLVQLKSNGAGSFRVNASSAVVTDPVALVYEKIALILTLYVLPSGVGNMIVNTGMAGGNYGYYANTGTLDAAAQLTADLTAWTSFNLQLNYLTRIDFG